MAGSLLRDYIASGTLTITLASLATDSNLLTGRESTSVDNSTNDYEDYSVGGTIMTGTSPTDAKQIEVHAIGILSDSVWPDVFDGTDSAETISSLGTKANICKPIAIIPTTNTSNQAYWFGPVFIAQLFGDIPAQWDIFVTHNTGVNLNSTGGNHVIYYKGIAGRYT